MRKMSKKIIVSVLTLVLTVVALGTTTYAWFTVGGTVAVEEFEMQVTSGVGLEIAYLHSRGDFDLNDPKLNYVKSISAEDLYAFLYYDYYGTSLGLEEIKADISTYAGYWGTTFKMDAFTSMDGKSFYAIPENLPEDLVGWSIDPLDEIGLLPAGKTDGFIEFSLAFRTKEVEGTELYLNELNYKSDGMPWRPEKDFTKVGGEIFLATDSNEMFYAVNGTRISVTDDRYDEAAYADFDDILSFKSTRVFEKATDGNNNRQLGGGSTANFIWNQGAHSYYEAITQKHLETYYDEFEPVETQTTLTNGEEVVAYFTTFGAETSYKYARVTIRIYLEGFDSETFNAIFDDVIKARFGFNIKLD